MRRRKRNAEFGGPRNGDGGGGFGREAVDRLELHHLVTHRADDAPAAGGGAGRHGHCAEYDDPDRYLVDPALGVHGGLEPLRPFRGMGWIEGAGTHSDDECEGDDADGLLGVVRAVRESHQSSRDQLQFAEDLADDAWPNR